MSKTTEIYRTSGDTIVMLRDGDQVMFRIKTTTSDDFCVDGVVEYWDDENNNPDEFHRYLKFQIRNGGCSHLWMGQKGFGGKHYPEAGYFHFCGAKYWENHIWLLREIWKFAAAEMEMDEPAELRDARQHQQESGKVKNAENSNNKQPVNQPE